MCPELEYVVYLHQVCPELECVVSGWRSVIAVLLKDCGGASLICTCTHKTQLTQDHTFVIVSYPRTVAHNPIRPDKPHVPRCVCKLVMYVLTLPFHFFN